MKPFAAFLFSISIILFCNCSNEDNGENLISVEDPAYQKGVRVALKKAEQLTSIQWTPLAKIPKTRPDGSYFQPGIRYTGTPYSSVKELDKFIGQEVSFHTFLSAVRNPRSVLYTEFVNKAPYHGVNCAPYYGTVCSMSVNYALGIDAPFPSRSYASVSFMQKVTDYDVDLIKVCDVLASHGHTIMVVDYQTDDTGKIVKVKFLENGYYKEYERDALQDYWLKGKFVLYRYKDMAKNVICQDIEPVDSSPAICVQRGDKSIYREGELVVLNILDESYSEIELYKDDVLYEIRKKSSIDENYTDLVEGMYRARLVDETGRESLATCFEVRKIILLVKKMNNQLQVSFLGNSIPATAIELCTLEGDHLYTSLISVNDNLHGSVVTPLLDYSEPYYCKVFFQGMYGKVVSEYIRIN